MRDHQNHIEKLKKTRSLELINEFEQEFSVDKWEVNGLKIWPAIRIPLISAWEKELYYGDGALDSKTIPFYKRALDEIRLLSWSFLKYLTCFFKHTQADVGILGLDEERVKTSNGYYSPFGDALRDLERDSGLEFLCFDLKIKRSVSSFYPCIDLSFAYHFSRFSGKLYSYLYRKKKFYIDLNACRLWCKERKLPYNVLNDFFIRNSYYLIFFLKKHLQKVISKYKLKICFVSTWYSNYGMALSWAAKEQSIPCYDLQHGISGASSSRVYSSWSRIPAEGYKLIPSGFWCWTKEDALAVDQWGSNQTPPIRTVVGGCVWQRLWLENKQPQEIFSASNPVERLINVSRKNILFTTQGNNPPEILFDMLENSPSDWNWWIRCHPMMIEKLDNYERVFSRFGAKINVREATLTFLPFLLSKVDIHITGWSAVTYDALSFGIKTILTHPSAKQFFEPLLSSKQAFYIENWKEIFSLIESKQMNLRFDRSINKYDSVNKLIK